MLWSDWERLGTWNLDPWREFERMRRSITRPFSAAAADFPAVNVWTSADAAIVTTEIPGIDPKDIDISVVGKTFTLKGSRRPQEAQEGETFHRRERWHGQFTRSFDLPFQIQADKVHARFSKGVLSIELPRAEAEKPRKIEIRAE
ncbi:MAG: Hsp20/alpha crystallin family protein [Thermodesulfovibrionales bacterium]